MTEQAINKTEPEFVPATREDVGELLKWCGGYVEAHRVAESYIRLLADHEKLVDAAREMREQWSNLPLNSRAWRPVELALFRAAGIKEER